MRSQSLTPVVPVTTKKLKTKGKRLEKMMKKMNDRISKNQETWTCFCLRVENRTHEIPFLGLHHVHRCVSTRGSCPSSLPRYISHTCSHLESVRVQSATQCTECRYIFHTCSHLESICVQSATEWTASVHTLHMPAT